jgi:hypothetical protein
MRNLLIAGGAITAAAVLFFLLRPDDESEPTVAPTTNTATDIPTRTNVPQPPQPPPPAEARITVRDGLPVGGVRRITVSRGRRVILNVTSDVADHVHLHGYDLMRDVGPGRPARLAFRATILGTVEAELEDRRVQIASITTQP